MGLSEMNNKPKLATHETCVGCFACISRCPVSAISVDVHSDGHEYVNVNPEKCIGCLKCEKMCHSVLENYGTNELAKSEIFGGWSKDSLQREKGTSGGVFAALADHVIRNYGVVVGASFDGRTCKHKIIRSIEEIETLQGSKYTPSSLLGLYEAIDQELQKGVVLFTGLGCQCAAVLAYFENSKNKTNLITVDMVCGGIPSKKLIEKYFEARPDVKRIVSFRTKDKYELTVETEQGIQVDSDRPLPLYGFSCGMTNRESCYDCRFAFAHRKSDITIGDLWDYDTLPNEHNKGVSMIIVHSERGNKVLLEADIELQPIEWRGSLLHNKRIVCRKQRKFKYRAKLGEAIDSQPFSMVKKVYCLEAGHDLKLMAFKLYRKFKLAGDNRKNENQVNTILSQSGK